MCCIILIYELQLKGTFYAIILLFISCRFLKTMKDKYQSVYNISH